MFSGGRERVHWEQMGYNVKFKPNEKEKRKRYKCIDLVVLGYVVLEKTLGVIC